MSVDSDDQNFNNKVDDADGSLLVNGGYKYCESLRKNQCLDKNGNEVADSVNNNFYSDPLREALKGSDEDKSAPPKKLTEQKTVSRLQAMAMSDDEDDYGETFNGQFVHSFCISNLPTRRQLVSELNYHFLLLIRDGTAQSKLNFPL